ncbi:cytochrome c oxidase assembly protein [Amycolatopsis carbonis]|uniref:Cytochrome c oxidase assembly protein n=1 Tax=Amycolatopsis carbonis TaxID=715471 RepID=A0A9Y2IPN6_9PSEU|nr:cytochrome c oxidase assembly protein [Amycolatopsis sp. 2-15]WIX82866.1 cytochrome c oxidase assembly protein [Amycolatopsis sp. 2-15]
MFPPVTAVLEAGSLWLLYRTGLCAASDADPVPHGVVHIQVFLTGLLFTAVVCWEACHAKAGAPIANTRRVPMPHDDPSEAGFISQAQEATDCTADRPEDGEP